jgi:sporulation protein YlmC with PRC-barrel domain
MLQLHEHTKISDSDGRELGEVAGFVIDPGGKQLTHVIIEQGAVYPEDRIVPVAALDETEGGIGLRPGVNPYDLPEFDSSNYLEADSAMAPGWPSAFIWAYPIPSGAGFPAYPLVPNVDTVDSSMTRNMPEGSVFVDDGTTVVSANGTDVGSITEVAIADDGSLSHLVVDPGFFKAERIIPSHWIADIAENVVLGVDDKTLAKYDTR